MNQALYESLSKKAAHLMPADRLNPYDYSLYMKILTRLTVEECVRHFNEDYQRDFDTNWREDLSRSINQHFGVDE